MRFDPATALQYASSLARPRRVGTAANEDVTSELATRLRSFGLAVEVANFEFSSLVEAAVVLHVLAAEVLISVTFWAWGISALVAVLPALLLTAWLLAAGRLYRAAAAASLWPQDLAALTRLRRLWLARGRHYHTANIVAHIPPRPGSSHQAPLLLVAHSDSKSQALSLPARMGLIGMAGLAALIFTALNVTRVFFPSVTGAAALTGLVALVSGVPVLFLYLSGAGNASPGAIDNASGAGLVLHLAECLCADPPAVPVTVLITGAEEFGLLGALAFLRAEGQNALHSARVLNFDGIGTAGPLALVSGRGSLLAAFVRGVCGDLNFRVGRLPPMGAQFDHLPFVDQGIDALSLITSGRAALSVHTPQDNVSQLQLDGFRRAGEVALRVIEKLGRI